MYVVGRQGDGSLEYSQHRFWLRYKKFKYFEVPVIHAQPSEHSHEHIEDIYFFEVNTKYISSSVLKTSEFS